MPSRGVFDEFSKHALMRPREDERTKESHGRLMEQRAIEPLMPGNRTRQLPRHKSDGGIRHRFNPRQNGARAVGAKLLLSHAAIEAQRGTARRRIVYQNVTVCIGSRSAQRLPLGRR